MTTFSHMLCKVAQNNVITLGLSRPRNQPHLPPLSIHNLQPLSKLTKKGGGGGGGGGGESINTKTKELHFQHALGMLLTTLQASFTCREHVLHKLQRNGQLNHKKRFLLCSQRMTQLRLYFLVPSQPMTLDLSLRLLKVQHTKKN